MCGCGDRNEYAHSCCGWCLDECTCKPGEKKDNTSNDKKNAFCADTTVKIFGGGCKEVKNMTAEEIITEKMDRLNEIDAIWMEVNMLDEVYKEIKELEKAENAAKKAAEEEYKRDAERKEIEVSIARNCLVESLIDYVETVWEVDLSDVIDDDLFDLLVEILVDVEKNPEVVKLVNEMKGLLSLQDSMATMLSDEHFEMLHSFLQPYPNMEL